MPNFLIIAVGVVAGTFILKFYRSRGLSLVATIVIAIIISAVVALLAMQ